MENNYFFQGLFKAMGMNVTSDADYEVPVPRDMTINGDTFVSYHPDIPDGNMTKVIVPNGIKTIGENAFMGPNQSHNYYLECCRLPFGVTTIEKEAFALCASLSEIELPFTLKTIESGAFMYSGLTAIDLPEGLESIGEEAFVCCRAIKELRIPSTVTEIGYNCFSKMGVPLGTMEQKQSSAKILAPVELEDIFDPYYLDSLFAYHEVEWYSPDSDFFMEDDKLCLFIGLTHRAIVPKGVTAICDVAFYHRDRLTSITLPEGLISIGSSAFVGCTNLKEIYIPKSVISIGKKAFENCPNLKKICISKGDFKTKRLLIAQFEELGVALPGIVEM